LLPNPPKIAAFTYFVLLLLLPGQLFSQLRYRIDEVDIQGNTSFSSTDLQEYAFIATPSWFEENIMSAEPSFYTEGLEAQVYTQLKNFYQKEGFLQAQVSKPIVTLDEENRTASLRIELAENKAVLVGAVKVAFVDSAPVGSLNFDSLVAASHISWNLKAGMRFRDELATMDQSELSTIFARNGFPYARVTPELTVLSGDSVVDIRWLIDSRKRATFGAVNIEGNNKTPEDVILYRLDFQPGDVYDISKIKRTQHDIFNLSVFHGVNCKAQLGGGEPEVLPITVRVQEAPTITTKFGVGYGKEDKFRVFGNLQWLRFMGGARSLDFFAKHSALEPYHMSVTFTQPDFPFRLAKFVLNPYALKEVEPSYTATRLGSNVALKRDFFENLEVSTTYTYERVDQLSNAEGSENDSYRKSSVGLLFLNDASRPLFDPIRGWNVSGGVSYTRILSFDSTFFNTGVDVRRYFDPFGGTIVAAKLKTSLIFPIGAGNVPLEERLYSGGATSVRGFPRSSLGPVDANGIATGGNTLLEASLEFRIPVAGILGLVGFCDAGNVWQEPATYRISELRYAAGAGVRLKTPVGPVRFDVAKPIFEGDGEIEYYFTLGHAF